MFRFPCVICKTNKHPDSEEHIIPESLGANLTVSGVVCKKCNNDLGAEIDAPFVDSDYMRFLRYRHRDYLPAKAIPDFHLKTDLKIENHPEVIHGQLRFSKTQVGFAPRFYKEEIPGEVTYYFPDTPQGKDEFNGLKNSAKLKIKKAEWIPLPEMPSKIIFSLKSKVPIYRPAFKMFLTYFALKVGPEAALDQRFDPVRDYIRFDGGLSKTPFRVRVIHRKRMQPPGDNIKHEIGFQFVQPENIGIFSIIFFNYLKVDIDIDKSLPIIPAAMDTISLNRKRTDDFLPLFESWFEDDERA